MNESERRYRLVPIVFNYLLDLITEGWSTEGRTLTCIQGIPQGSKIIGSFLKEEKELVYLVAEHESFDPVPLGEMIPEIEITHNLIVIGDPK